MSSTVSSDAGGGDRHPRTGQGRAPSINSGGRGEALSVQAVVRRKELEVQEREKQVRGGHNP